jgi:acyl carrier protein
MLKQQPKFADISEAVRNQIGSLLDEKNLPVRNLGPDDRLNADLGLTSLDLATLVAALEVKLKADPFQELVPITSVRTIADLEAAYVKFFSNPENAAGDVHLDHVRRRAECRRNDRRSSP